MWKYVIVALGHVSSWSTRHTHTHIHSQNTKILWLSACHSHSLKQNKISNLVAFRNQQGQRNKNMTKMQNTFSQLAVVISFCRDSYWVQWNSSTSTCTINFCTLNNRTFLFTRECTAVNLMTDRPQFIRSLFRVYFLFFFIFVPYLLIWCDRRFSTTLSFWSCN